MFLIKVKLEKETKETIFPNHTGKCVLSLMGNVCSKEFLKLHKKTNVERKVGE